MASGKRGGQRFGAHTLRLTKLLPVTYSALTFKKKILTRPIHTPNSHAVLTRRTHTPSSSLNYPFTRLSYCLYNPSIGQKR